MLWGTQGSLRGVSRKQADVCVYTCPCLRWVPVFTLSWTQSMWVQQSCEHSRFSRGDPGMCEQRGDVQSIHVYHWASSVDSCWASVTQRPAGDHPTLTPWEKAWLLGRCWLWAAFKGNSGKPLPLTIGPDPGYSPPSPGPSVCTWSGMTGLWARPWLCLLQGHFDCAGPCLHSAQNPTQIGSET